MDSQNLNFLILRGVSGSGKTTLGAKLVGETGVLLSVEDYFTERRMKFDPKKLPDARKWNYDRTFISFDARISPIVLDDTNLIAWPLRHYAQKAIDCGYTIAIHEPDTPWKKDAAVCAQKNIHNATEDAIKKMLEGYQEYTVDEILTSEQPLKRSFTPSVYEPKNTGLKLYILRGIAGSGKSTLAKTLAGDEGLILSTDDFFNVNGTYQFDAKKLSEAHKWNQERAIAALEAHKNPIVIDNTNLQPWEPKIYVTKGIENGYDVDIVEPDTPWKRDVNELAKKNTHGVDAQGIAKMLERMVNYTVTDVLNAQLPDFNKRNVNTPKKVAVTADIQERMQKMKLQENSEKVLYVLRGISGSGKSTLSKKLIGDTGIVFSTDDYFMVNGAYQFDVKKLGEAHKWNQERASAAIEAGRSPIVIDNTNLQAWEPKAYVVKAVDCGYSVKVVEPDTPWKRDANELAKRNTHGVNAEVIGKMLDRMENYTVEDILVAQQPEWKKPTPVVTTPKKSEREPVIVTKDGFTVINTNTKRKPATGPKSPVVTPKKDNKEASTKSYGNSFALLSDE